MKYGFVAGGLAALTVCAGAGAAQPTDFERALDERYRAVEAAIEARDGARWFDELYSPNIVLVGEGTKEVVRGRAALMPVIDAIVKDTRACRIRPDGARKASADLGYSFVTYRCSPVDTSAPDYEVRALFVWERAKAGWRVVAETYTMGSM